MNNWYKTPKYSAVPFELFKLKVSVKTFLETSNILNSIQQTCCCFSENISQVLYPFDVCVNLLHLMQDYSSLCHVILEDPLTSVNLFKEVIYEVIRELHWLPRLENISQIVITVRITELPDFSEYRISNFRDLLSKKSCQYYQFDGLVVAQTTVAKYTQGAVYECPNSLCPGSVGYNFIRIHVPGAQECQIVREDFECTFCGQALRENVAARVLSEKIIAKMVPLNSVNSLDKYFVSQALAVYVRGYLVQRIKIGRCYKVTGLMVNFKTCFPSKSPYLEANFISECDGVHEASFSCFDSLQITMNQLLCLPGIKDMMQWPRTFPYILSYYFADCIVQAGLFYKLKLGMLLALATCGNNSTNTNMTILVVGDDTVVTNRLLLHGCDLAPRYTTLTEYQQLKIHAKQNCDSSSAFLIEGNPLLLASGGICFLGDISKFNNMAKKEIAFTLENSFVKVQTVKGNLVPELVELPQSSYATDCQVWSYTNCSGGLPDKGFESKHNTDAMKHLIDSFSIVFYTDAPWTGENQQKDLKLVAESLLKSNMPNGRESSFRTTEMKAFLGHIQRQTVHFNRDAEQIIQGYYVSSRKIRNSPGKITISINAITTITLLAEAYAKLSLKQNVTEDDAIAAILLYEEYLALRYGPSCFNVSPVLHLTSTDIYEDIKMINEQHKAFELNLRHIIAAYGKDTILSESEE